MGLNTADLRPKQPVSGDRPEAWIARICGENQADLLEHSPFFARERSQVRNPPRPLEKRLLIRGKLSVVSLMAIWLRGVLMAKDDERTSPRTGIEALLALGFGLE